MRIRPFLMFQGAKASGAIAFYTALFPDTELGTVDRYGAGEAGAEGSIRHAVLRIGDQELQLIDSPIDHAFDFTPSISLFVHCGSEEELRRLAGALAESGAELMPVGNYGFSTLYAWVTDRFGVSWQLSFG